MWKGDGSVDVMLAPKMCELLMWSRKTVAYLGYLLFFVTGYATDISGKLRAEYSDS